MTIDAAKRKARKKVQAPRTQKHGLESMNGFWDGATIKKMSGGGFKKALFDNLNLTFTPSENDKGTVSGTGYLIENFKVYVQLSGNVDFKKMTMQFKLVHPYMSKTHFPDIDFPDVKIVPTLQQLESFEPVLTMRKIDVLEPSSQTKGSKTEDKEEEGTSEDYNCGTCIVKPRNTLFFPCGHFYLCWECYEKLGKKECPCCRVGIKDARLVFRVSKIDHT